MENQFWKRIILCALVVAVTMLPAACSDDDDDDSPAAPASGEQTDNGNDNPADGNEPEASFEMLDLYDFTLSIQEGEPNLTLTQTVSGTERRLILSNRDGGSFIGTYDPVAQILTFDSGSTFVIVTINYFGGSDLDGLSILVEEDIVFQEDVPGIQNTFPGEGAFSIRYKNNIIVVDFVSDDGSPGVHMRFNDEPVIFYPYNDFIHLLDENVLVWQQKASLVFHVIEFLAEQAILSARTGEVIVAHAASLEKNGSITFDCGTFPSNADVDDLPTLAWLDTDESGGISPGDTFRWDFTSCWINEEEGLIDDLLRGRIDLLGRVGDVEQRDSVDFLTRFGFDPEVQTSTGVTYSNLVQTEIEGETLEQVSINPERTYIVSGGYNILFSEPAGAE